METIDLKVLSLSEVRKKMDRGQTNDFTTNTSTSTWQIIKRNVFTLFNTLNFVIAVALAAVQAWSNMIFFAVICFNAITGIMTEMRAKRMIDKLNLMSRELVTVIRDGEKDAIPPEKLVLGDVMLLSSGEQIPSDAEVMSGIAEANEAMLTGESDLVLKEVGDELLSGSYIASGQVYARVKRVGANNYANKLMMEAKTLKPINSRILYNLAKISSFTGKIIIPFGLALFFEALLIKMLPIKDSVVNSSTALLGMLPKGIALLTVTSLLTAVIKLGMRKVLVQEMYSVETLARVDTLCLDKTGTITQGKMTVEALHSLSDHFSEQTIQVILSAYMQYSEDTNPTAQAIRKAYGELEHAYTAENIIPFSSDRKWGAMHLSNLGTVFLGAPEMLLKENPAPVVEAQARGSRVLVLAHSSELISMQELKLPENLEGIAVIEITDPIREGASDTLEYLRSQGVDLKIISGDNPVTVS
ncbi:MAG: HAD-IC family P-type ATPase, partial [Streptococcus parasanguinis]|nr:HAD-IC family P-type ATPase [Streptococcus parasanguinis]